jgi:tight adherence protein B
MEMQLIIIVAVFATVVTSIVAVTTLLSGRKTSTVEDRLEVLTGAGGTRSRPASENSGTLLAGPLDETVSFVEVLMMRFGNPRKYLEQADLRMNPSHFFLISVGMATFGGMVCIVTKCPVWFAPGAAILLGITPLIYVWMKRKRRLAAFTRQLPDALELIGRALRAGHSLAAGFSLVGDEMSDPVGTEFLRCYEEQNLGIPLEEALNNMTDRAPNLDLRFFATAVILQRQTGGDLAEILDKIGSLIRERFKIWGQIQALTGEGRLSGIVLLALPPVLFVVMFRLNPKYCMVLFNDPVGQWMLGGAVLMQILGALVIRKIINIKV